MRKTFGTMKSRVSRLANDISNDGVERGGEFLNDAQEFIQGTHPWSFLKHLEATIDLTANLQEYDTPDGMYNISRVYYKDSDNTINNFLWPAGDKEFLKYYDGQTADSPSVYRLLDLSTTNYQPRIQIGVAPSAGHIAKYTNKLYLEQFNKLTDLTSDLQYSDLPYDFTSALEFLAAGMMCQSQSDMTTAAGYLATYKMFIDELIMKDVNRYRKQFPIVPKVTAAPRGWANRNRSDYGQR